jgi:hypothetical protein
MNKMAIRFGAVAVLAGASLANGPAFAAATTATTQIFGVQDDAGLLTFSNPSYLLDASTPNLYGFDAGSSPANQSLSEGSGSSASLAGALIDGFGLPTASAQAQGTGAAHATAMWSFDWTATGAGTVNLSVEYLASAIVANLAPGDSALAKSFLQVTLDGTSIAGEALNYLDNQAGNLSDWNFLALSFAVAQGDTGTLTITAQSDATTVPTPATLWLLGAAFPGFLAAARRSGKSAA